MASVSISTDLLDLDVQVLSAGAEVRISTNIDEEPDALSQNTRRKGVRSFDVPDFRDTLDSLS